MLCLVLMISAVYSRPPIPIDETRYLSVAWEMWQSHDFLVPHINGHPYSHKPPLLFWLIHLSWLLFGVGEWSGRLVGPLFGFGSLILTVQLAGVLWPANRGVRLAAPFILLGTFIWTLYSTLTMFDSLLTFISLSALLFILKAGRRSSLAAWAGLGLTIGLGILAKGPVVLLYVLPPVLLAPLWKRKDGLSWGRWYGSSFLALLAGIAVALCWAIPAAIAGGEEYRQAILFRQTAGRMVKAFAHGRPFYWYTLLLPLLILPWFFWLPAWRGWGKRSFDSSSRFCLAVVLPAFMLLSCVSGKQIHYILPLLPLVALLLAHWLTTAPVQTSYDRVPILAIFLLMALALVVVPQLSLHGGDREMLQYLPKWIAIVPLAAGLLLFLSQADSILAAIKIVSSTILLLVILLHLALAAPLHKIYDQTVVGRRINKAQEQNGQVAVFPSDMADQFQFAGRLTTPLVPQQSLADLAKWSEGNPGGYCLIFTASKYYGQLTGSGIARQYSKGRLIFRPARNFAASYGYWLTESNSQQQAAKE